MIFEGLKIKKKIIAQRIMVRMDREGIMRIKG
jgi:hypothetical protein